MQFKFIDKVSNLIILNILYIISIFSILGFASGESALVSTLIKMVRHEESYVYKNFKKHFFKDYWKNLIALVISVIPPLLLLIGFFVLPYVPLPVYIISILRHMGMVILIIYLISVTFIIPLNARYKNTIKNTIHNSILLVYKHFFLAVLIRVIDFIPILSFFIFQEQLLVWISFMLFILPSAVKYINAHILNYIFSQYEKLN